MFKLLTFTCIFLALSSVYTQNCSTTRELRTLYGFANTVSSPTAASGVNYCKSIKSSNVCCTPSDINGISDKSDTIVKNLTSLVSTRDTYLKTVKDKVVPQLLLNINEFVPIAQDFTDFTNSVNLTGVSGFDELLGSIDSLVDVAGFLLTNLSTVKSNYGTYQKARTSCIVEMVSLQNAAYCLACDPNAGTKGYSYSRGSFNFNISSGVCNRLKSSCSAYISDAMGQNVLIATSYYASFLNVLGGALQTLMTGNLTAIATLVTAMENMQGPLSAAVAPADVPKGCDGGSCDWICNGLFSNGQVDQLSLITGGEVDDGSRRLVGSNDRMLAGSSWSPDKDESGVTVTFEDDPAGTDKSAGIIGNVFISMMVLISAILLL